MIDKVFSITGEKISALIIDDDSLKFSSASADTIDAFREAFDKKISLATKVEIKYNLIKSIKKGDKDKNILIKYKTALGLPGDCKFSFNNAADYELFFSFFEKKMFFTKTRENVTSFKAIKNYLIGLLATIAFTAVLYYQAVAIANGTARKPHSGKSILGNYIIRLIGDKGVIAVGCAISLFLIYLIWRRFSNPPNQTKLLPPHA
jgi:hypothetical protein